MCFYVYTKECSRYNATKGGNNVEFVYLLLNFIYRNFTFETPTRVYVMATDPTYGVI